MPYIDEKLLRLTNVNQVNPDLEVVLSGLSGLSWNNKGVVGKGSFILRELGACLCATSLVSNCLRFSSFSSVLAVLAARLDPEIFDVVQVDRQNWHGLKEEGQDAVPDLPVTWEWVRVLLNPDH